MNLVTLRTAMAVLTGILGILGTIIETKHKTTRRVTWGGWVVLSLIVVSVVIGVIAQVKQSTEDERAKNTATMQALTLAKKSDQTLTDIHALAKKSDQTVTDIQRMLAPLDDVRIDFSFQVGGCNGKHAGPFCSLLRGMSRNEFIHIPPGGDRDFAIEVHFFRDRDLAQKFLQEGGPTDETSGNFVFFIDSGQPHDASKDFASESDAILYQDSTSNSPGFEISNAPIRDVIKKDGSIISVPDLHGSTLVWIAQQVSVQGLVPKSFRLHTKSGQEIVVSQFEKMTKTPASGDMVEYISTIP